MDILIPVLLCALLGAGYAAVHLYTVREGGKAAPGGHGETGHGCVGCGACGKPCAPEPPAGGTEADEESRRGGSG